MEDKNKQMNDRKGLDELDDDDDDDDDLESMDDQDLDDEFIDDDSNYRFMNEKVITLYI